MQDSETLLPSPFAGGSAQSGFDVARLLSPEQALAKFFTHAQIGPAGIEEVPLEGAAGRVLARDATAREDHPAHPRSTMDGFAVASGPPSRLRIVGEVLMGHAPPGKLGPGEAMRVPTGGALPDGADAVVPQEDVEFGPDRTIVVRETVRPWECVTPQADDVRRGERVLAAGRRLGAPELGVLATLGIVPVAVYLRPRVAIVSTGDELVDPSQTLRVGQVRDSNRYAIAAALEALGAEPVHLPRCARYARRALVRGARRARSRCLRRRHFDVGRVVRRRARSRTAHRRRNSVRRGRSCTDCASSPASRPCSRRSARNPSSACPAIRPPRS
jgi:molybdopterin molybdotransferase